MVGSRNPGAGKSALLIVFQSGSGNPCSVCRLGFIFSFDLICSHKISTKITHLSVFFLKIHFLILLYITILFLLEH